MSESVDVPAGAVVITPSEMYRTMIETRDAVLRLEVAVNPALTSLQAKQETLSERVSALERFRWLLAGVAVGAGAGAGGIISAVLR